MCIRDRIGRALCKDHTTIISGAKQAKAKLGDTNWLQQLRKTTELLALPLVA
jgi:chromosomal replication initiation ATPase DnaA